MAFENNTKIPLKYKCDGDNISPDLSFQSVPEETKSLALIVTDPDAPSGTFTHWNIWNISPETYKIEEGATPNEAVVGMNYFGNMEYGGPCPPHGDHRYFFRLYDLDTMLNLDEGSKRLELEEVMKEHILDTAEIMRIYGR